MSPRAKKGPLPQDHRIAAGLEAFVSGALDVVTGIIPGSIDDALAAVAAPKLRELALELLEAADVNTAGLTITAAKPPRVKRIKRDDAR